MLGALFKKMTDGMLFFLVVPTAVLICALSWLIFAYGFVVWNSDEVSYKGSFGEVTTRVSNIENRLKDALKSNEELRKTNIQQQKLLDNLNKKCMQGFSQVHTRGDNYSVCSITSGFSENLKHQSELLVNQKQKLDDINQDVAQVKEELRLYGKSSKGKV